MPRFGFTFRNSGVINTPGATASPPAAAQQPYVSTFTLPMGYNADLTSRQSNFGVASQMNWPPGDVTYIVDQSNGEDYLDLENNPWSTVPLGASGGWTYQTCATANYQSVTADDPDGSNIAPNHGICFYDANANQYLLLVVQSQTDQSITLQVTDWPSTYS